MWSDACGVNSLQWIANGYEFLVLIISQLSKSVKRQDVRERRLMIFMKRLQHAD